MFDRIRKSLTRTRTEGFSEISEILGTGPITEETWEDLEALLIQADLGVDTTIFLVDELREKCDNEGIRNSEHLVPAMKQVMRGIFFDPPEFQIDTPRLLTVVMVVGVNGSGKTTSLGKLAFHYKEKGRKVALVAGDTFRAAAIDQIKVWAERADVPIIAGEPGSDAAAAIYDGIRASRAREYDLLLIDTAGRLHNRFNLMKELEKVRGVAEKSVHQAPHEVLLVIDAPTGQNALVQAEKFKESVGVTGVILTKLDGTGKGGMVFSIYRDLGLPIRFIGTGEGVFDLTPFDADAFVGGLFDEE